MTSLKQRREKVLQIITVLRKLFPHAKISLHFSNPLELLIAVMLSAQCTDKMVNKVTENLFKKYKTVNDYADANQEAFEKDIHSTGFYRAKAKNVIATAKLIRDTFGGKVPKTMEELVTLPGVARKTANIVLSNAYGKIEGIAVDTHVRRLSKLLGLTTNDDPVKIEKDLMEIVPKEEWNRITYLLIEYGRTYCSARPHDHSKCPLFVVQ